MNASDDLKKNVGNQYNEKVAQKYMDHESCKYSNSQSINQVINIWTDYYWLKKEMEEGEKVNNKSTNKLIVRKHKK